jgi:hypothetical protein
VIQFDRAVRSKGNFGLSHRQGGSHGIYRLDCVELIAGLLAGQVMKGGGYGALVDIILGILGGIVGGWVFELI